MATNTLPTAKRAPTPNESAALKALSALPGHHGRELARAAGVLPASMALVLARFERTGLAISRRTDQRRHYWLTAAGERLAKSLDGA